MLLRNGEATRGPYGTTALWYYGLRSFPIVLILAIAAFWIRRGALLEGVVSYLERLAAKAQAFSKSGEGTEE